MRDSLTFVSVGDFITVITFFNVDFLIEEIKFLFSVSKFFGLASCWHQGTVSDDFFFAVDAWTISFSPDSRFLATGSHSGKINLFGVESGRKEESLDIRGGFTLSIAYVSIALLKFRSQTN